MGGVISFGEAAERAEKELEISREKRERALPAEGSPAEKPPRKRNQQASVDPLHFHKPHNPPAEPTEPTEPDTGSIEKQR